MTKTRFTLSLTDTLIKKLAEKYPIHFAISRSKAVEIALEEFFNIKPSEELLDQALKDTLADF